VEEMRRLNAKVRAVLPVAGDDWLRVAYQFNYLRPEGVPYREVESLKRKFKKMYCARGKALADYLLEAKELRGLITQRSESETQPEEEKVGTTELASRLRQMEVEYHRTVEGPTPGDAEQHKEVKPVSPVLRGCAAARVTTSGIIEMLRQSVDRKRRSAEETVLSENSRVRRERKKRKMEQTLLSIHHEQREHDLSGDASGAATAAEAAASTAASSSTAAAADLSQPDVTSPSQQQPPSSAGASTVPVLPASLNAIGAMVQPPFFQDAQSLGVMELLLQFMTAQQLENAQRLETEQAQREQERRERDKRRHQNELQRRQDHHELMLAMGALLGDRFPASLRHYLDDTDGQSTAAPPTATTPINDAVVSTQAKATANEQQSGETSSHLPVGTPVSITTDQSDARTRVAVEHDSVQSRIQQASHEATSAIL